MIIIPTHLVVNIVGTKQIATGTWRAHLPMAYGVNRNDEMTEAGISLCF